MSDVKGFSGIGGRDLESGRFPTAQMFGLRLRLGPLGGEGGSGVIQHSGLGGDQRLPEAVVAKQGVGEHDELADDGGDRDLVRFAAVGQPLVEDAHVGVAAAGGSASHVEHLARAGPPARTGFHAPLERLHFSNLPLDVDRTDGRLECGFLDRLGECRVSVA